MGRLNSYCCCSSRSTPCIVVSFSSPKYTFLYAHTPCSVVQFMGLVALPPALMTGGWSGVCPCRPLVYVLVFLIHCCPLQSAEYCSRGSLYDCLTAARKQPAVAAQLTWHRRLAMAADAGTGLCYLHRRGIIHRDGELAMGVGAFSKLMYAVHLLRVRLR